MKDPGKGEDHMSMELRYGQECADERPAWLKTYDDIGVEVMSAPNRYRKLLKDALVEGSHAIEWFFSAGFGPEGERLRETAREMMRADWPEKADRVIGMEPAYTLHDVLLLWRAS